MREAWQENLAAILGAANVCIEPGERHQSVWDEISPRAVACPADREQVCELMRLADAERLKVVPVGHGTKLRMGGASPPIDFAISLERLNQVSDYPASDLTISVEAGLPIHLLESTLAAKGQMLPLDVPFAKYATVGGTIAANVNGPRRLAYGSWRDIVLGVQYVTAEGKLAKGGGKVVKNVAGYDTPKLMIGSMGTLGVMVEVTFKAFPVPPATATLMLRFRSAQQAAQAALRIVHSQLVPQALDLIDSPAYGSPADQPWLQAPGTLLARLAGAEEVLARYERELPALVRADGLESFEIFRGDRETELWRTVREMTPAFLRRHPNGVIVKAALPFTRMGEFIELIERARASSEKHGIADAILARAGSGIVYAHLWSIFPEKSEAHAAGLAAASNALISAAEQRGGRAIVEWCPSELKNKVNLWGTLGDDFTSMRSLKAALDPNLILSPGRFYGGI